MNNLNLLLISFAYVLVVLVIGSVIARKQKKNSELSRKVIHILVGNWVFITPFFTELWAVLAVPLAFVFINTISLKVKLIPAMERNDNSLGTVYYAISLVVLSGVSFILKWPQLVFIGVLVLAYGDGLAALIGQKYGKKSLVIAPSKTLAGSLTVLVVAFVVTLMTQLIFPVSSLSIWNMLLIALLTALLAPIIELAGTKGCDNLSLPIGTGLFATILIHYYSNSLIFYTIIIFAILIYALKSKSIDLSAFIAAVLTGVTLFSMGGSYLAYSLLSFFILGSLISKLTNEKKEISESLQEHTGARNWIQVLANSLPATLLVWVASFQIQQDVLILLAFSVFSAASADTFSSEIGMLSKGPVFNILTGKKLAAGVSGGVSMVGLLAGLLGSALLALFAIPEFGSQGFVLTLLLGLLGSVIDSVLGATLQRKYHNEEGIAIDRRLTIDQKVSQGFALISNNAVNLLTLSLVVLLGLIIIT